MWQTLRTIVEDEPVREAVDAFSEEYPRFEDAWDALKWLLARRAPMLGASQIVKDKEYRLYVQAGDVLAETPDIWVVFTYDQTNVYIHGINAEKTTPDPTSTIH